MFDLALSLVLSDAVASWGGHENLVDLHQSAGDVSNLESLEQRSESGLQGDCGAKNYSLLWDDDAVFDFIGPDVFNTHGMEELQGGRFERPYNAQSLLGVQVVGQFASCNGCFQVVGNTGLGHALDALAKIAREHKLEWPLIIALVQSDALARLASHEGRPSVIVESLVAVDFLVRNASRRDARISPAVQ